MTNKVHKHITIYFDKNDVLHIAPKDDMGAMALKYWFKEYEKHGAVLVDVSFDIPPALPAPK